MRGHWIAVVCALLPACSIHDELVSCPDDGLLCAVGDICDSVHHICITPEQAAVCSGMPDTTPCTAGPLNGACNMGVCLPTGCGNHVVDQGEVCDDGNRIDGDGCNAVCTSTEACGNGTIDTARGETCDDGNLMSRDGCDSRCGIEQETWTLDGIAPIIGGIGWSAYDPVRHRIVHVGRVGTWELNGLDWKLITLTGPPAFNWHQVVWAPTISRIVYIGGSSINPLEAWTWDGSTWTHLATQSAPKMSVPAAAFYPPTGTVMAVGQTASGTQLWSLDLGSGTWTQITTMPTFYFSYGGAMVFDATRNTLVILAGGDSTANAPQTIEWNGTSWTVMTADLGGPVRQWGLVYDPVNAGVIAVGGYLTSTGTAIVRKWVGTTTWSALTSLPGNRYDVEVAFDTDTQHLVVVKGITAAGLADGIMTRTGTTWSGPSRANPSYSVTAGFAYDYGRGRIVRYGGQAAPNQTWSYDGTWHDLTTPLMPMLPTGALGYDPVRNALVISAVNNGTWLLEGDAWRQLASTDTGHTFAALTYDPGRRALVGVDGGGVAWQLPSDGDAWSTLTPSLIGVSGLTLAYDARAGTVIATDDSDGRVSELTSTGWSGTLSPGAYHRAVANTRRGTVEFVAMDGTPSWERIDGVWFSHPAPPYTVIGVSAIESPRASELIVTGNIDDAWVIARRQFISAVPTESCVAGEDTDGDGQLGCADADCWFTCTPACPPYTSCP